MAYTDNFNRASLGANWTTIGYTGINAMQIASSAYAVGSSASPNDNAAYYNAGSFGDYIYSTATIYKGGSSNNYDVGPVIYKSTGGYIYHPYWSTGNLRLQRVTSGGSWTNIGSDDTASVANGDTVSIEVTDANNLKLKWNGSTQRDVADNTYRSSLLPGIYGTINDATNYLAINDWEGGDVSGLTLDQEGFRWRNDDGTETTATWKDNQDTDITAGSGTARLRIIVNATGDPATQQYQLEGKLSTDSTWVKI